eukprot:6371325-Pyramimonas_sp.AAC.2
MVPVPNVRLLSEPLFSTVKYIYSTCAQQFTSTRVGDDKLFTTHPSLALHWTGDAPGGTDSGCDDNETPKPPQMHFSGTSVAHKQHDPEMRTRFTESIHTPAERALFPVHEGRDDRNSWRSCIWWDGWFISVLCRWWRRDVVVGLGQMDIVWCLLPQQGRMSVSPQFACKYATQPHA